MKKIIYVIILSFILLFSMNKVFALSVSKNNFTINAGESDKIELYANSEKEITRVEFILVYSSYDVVGTFYANGNYSYSSPANNTHRVSFGEGKSGSILLGTVNIKVSSNPKDDGGSINIHSAKGYTEDGEVVSLRTSIVNINIGNKPVIQQPKEETKVEEKKEEKKEEENKKEEKEETKEENKEEDTNLLSRIDSKIIKINLKKDVFEYNVSIDKDIQELDLVPIAIDDKTKIDISSQKIDELKDNKIIINTSNGDIKQEYVINVSQKKDIEVSIDKSEFKANSNYKGKWVVAAILFIVILIVSLFFVKDKK